MGRKIIDYDAFDEGLMEYLVRQGLSRKSLSETEIHGLKKDFAVRKRFRTITEIMYKYPDDRGYYFYGSTMIETFIQNGFSKQLAALLQHIYIPDFDFDNFIGPLYNPKYYELELDFKSRLEKATGLKSPDLPPPPKN